MQKEYKCTVCGEPNAKFRKYKRVTGLLLLSFMGTTKPIPVCDKHKSIQGLKVNIYNFIFGWWGITAFVWNIIAIIQNLAGGEDVTKYLEEAHQEDVNTYVKELNTQG